MMDDHTEQVQKIDLWAPNPNPEYVYVIQGMDESSKKVVNMWIFAPFEIPIVVRKEGHHYARAEPWHHCCSLPESSKTYGEIQFAFHLTPEIKQWNRFEYLFMKLDREKTYTLTVGQKEFTGTPKELLASYIHHVRTTVCINTVSEPVLKV